MYKQLAHQQHCGMCCCGPLQTTLPVLLLLLLLLLLLRNLHCFLS
jgi:hypothetical protein